MFAKRDGFQVLVDTNHYKTFVWDRLALGIGARTSWRIMKETKQRVQMFADEVCAEYPTKTEGRGRELYEWQLLPGKRENHRFDNCVGLAVAANMQGCLLPSADSELKKKKQRKRVKFGSTRR